MYYGTFRDGIGWSAKGEARVGIFMLDAVAVVMRRGKNSRGASGCWKSWVTLERRRSVAFPVVLWLHSRSGSVTFECPFLWASKSNQFSL